MDGPAFVRPAGNGPKGETGTTVKNQKTGGFLRPEGALIPPPQDAAWHRMGVEVHWEIPEDLPKFTKLMVDGKALYIHRANFQMVDSSLL